MRVTPEQFGAIGDGVTDDATAFRDMGVALRAKPLELNIVECGSGKIYSSSDQGWLSGVLNYRIEGNGCVWTAPIGSNTAINATLTNPFKSYNLSNPDDFKTAEQSHTGCKIETVEAGRQVAVLTSEGLADAQDGFLRLGICLVHSASQQGGGWPPNAALYEWNEVTCIDLASGEVEFAKPLLLVHRSDNIQDYQIEGVEREGWGPARITSFQGEKAGGFYLYPRRAYYRDLTFAPVDAQSYQVPSGLDVRFENVTFDHSGSTWPGTAGGPSIVRRFVFDRCRWLPDADGHHKLLEPDKLVGDFSVLDSELSGMSQMTGVDNLTVKGCDIFAQSIGGAPNRWLIEDSVFRTAGGVMVQQAGAWPSGGGLIRNCHASTSDNAENVVPAILGLQANRIFTVEEIGPNGQMIWNYLGVQSKGPSRWLCPGGAVIFTADGNKAGAVSHVEDNGDGNGAVYARLNHPAAVGDRFYLAAARDFVRDGGGNQVEASKIRYLNRVSGYAWASEPNRTISHIHGIENVKIMRGFSQRHNVFTSIMRGWIDYIEVDVTKDYTGLVSSPENYIAFYGENPIDGVVEIARIGLAAINKTVITNPAPGKFWHNFHITGFTGTNDWPPESEEVYPIVSIRMDVRGLEV